jgi:hypothetical protein
VGKPEGKRPLGRHRRRREDNVKMNLKEIGWFVMDWIYLARDRDQWRTLAHKSNFFTLVSCLAYSSILKMETTCSSETSIYFNGLHGVISQKKQLFKAVNLRIP